MRHLRRVKLAAVAVLAFWAGQTFLRAVTLVLTNSDVLGSSSFNSGLNWANGAAPGAGNAYQTSVFRLRSPAAATPVIFAGSSLEVHSGGGDLRRQEQQLLF